jgi:DNA-binding MarR family transcriptional regulator
VARAARVAQKLRGDVRRTDQAAALARLLEQVSRGIHSMGFKADLYPAQWAALRYFAAAMPDHATSGALARYQGLASGPVSRTVRTLIVKGYLRKAGSAGRGRAEKVLLTQKGRNLLAKDPIALIRGSLNELSDAERTAFAVALELVLRALHARDE